MPAANLLGRRGGTAPFYNAYILEMANPSPVGDAMPRPPAPSLRGKDAGCEVAEGMSATRAPTDSIATSDIRPSLRRGLAFSHRLRSTVSHSQRYLRRADAGGRTRGSPP